MFYKQFEKADLYFFAPPHMVTRPTQMPAPIAIVQALSVAVSIGKYRTGPIGVVCYHIPY